MDTSTIYLIALLIGLLFIIVLYALLSIPHRTVTVGKYLVLDSEHLCTTLPICFFQNIESPYSSILFRPPNLDPNNYVGPNRDKIADELLGAASLYPNEALVVYGMSPNCGYWSFIPYLFRRSPSSPTVFTSLSDGVNNYMLPANFHNSTGGQYPFVIIATRNRVVYDLELEFVLKALPAGQTVIPIFFPDVVDDITQVALVGRATLFADQKLLRKYIDNSGIVAYKVSYTDVPFVPVPVSISIQNLQPNGIKLRTLPTYPSEESIAGDFQDYVRATIANYTIISNIPIFRFLQDVLGIPYNNGYQCLENDILCHGDNRQSYYSQSDIFNAEAGRRILIVAVNHSAYGRGIYSQVSIYDSDRQYGLSSLSKLPSDPLFYYFIWDIEKNGNYVLAERSYVQMPAAVGPDANTIIPAFAYIVE